MRFVGVDMFRAGAVDAVDLPDGVNCCEPVDFSGADPVPREAVVLPEGAPWLGIMFPPRATAWPPPLTLPDLTDAEPPAETGAFLLMPWSSAANVDAPNVKPEIIAMLMLRIGFIIVCLGGSCSSANADGLAFEGQISPVTQQVTEGGTVFLRKDAQGKVSCRIFERYVRLHN